MTFWDGFLPALGVFAAAGVAYVTWRYWKQTLFLVISAVIVGAVLIAWPHIESRLYPATAKPTTLTFDDLIPARPKGRNLFADDPKFQAKQAGKELACDNPFGDLPPGADAFLERCKDDPAYIAMKKEWAIKEAQAKAAAAAKAEQDRRAASGQ